MALNINNLKQLKKFDSHLTPAKCLADAKSGKAELHMYQDSENLPRLHLVYRENHFVSLKTAQEAAEAKALGYTVEEDTTRDERSWHCYAQDKQESHLWLCNFRRYGWSITQEAKGHYGYAHGVTYANGPAIYHIASTSEQVVRDALVHTWAMGLGEGLIPKFFDQPEVHALLNQLLVDAFHNIGPHAAPRATPDGWGEVKVSVITKKTIKESELRTAR